MSMETQRGGHDARCFFDLRLLIVQLPRATLPKYGHCDRVYNSDKGYRSDLNAIKFLQHIGLGYLMAIGLYVM